MATLQKIELDFETFVLNAHLFDTPIARRFCGNLPCRVSLTRWGDELYGRTGADLGADSPVQEIPEGGIAYTNSGNYVCLFFGQTPAWPVEYIGRIEGEGWKQLVDASVGSVTIRPA